MGRSTSDAAEVSAGNGSLEPPAGPVKLWHLKEPLFEGYKPVDVSGFRQSKASSAIVIDNGSSTIRAGWSFDANPRLQLPPLMARYRDRKISKTFTLVGTDVYADGSARGQAKSAYEPGSNIVNNWDVVEGCLDYIFHKLGVDAAADGGIGRPVVMTEPVVNLPYARKTMSEILYECYRAPAVAYGIDSLFSYRYNQGRSGLVISSSYTSTHLIPVIEGKPLLSLATRLNWGRFQSAEYLQKLLRLKYPFFPEKFTDTQMEDLVKEHCYVAQDYELELSTYLDWTGLEERDHVIQYPYTEQVLVQKSEEELERLAEKRRENGRRLREQAAKSRLEKLMKKEQDLEYYKQLQTQLTATTVKKEIKRLLESADLEDEAQLEKTVREMERSIRKARNKDVGDAENDEDEPPTFPLLEVPDDQLDEDGLKSKRQQRLMKSGYEARMRAKAEKEKEKARLVEAERLDQEKRASDPDAWLEEKRQTRMSLVTKLKDRERLKADLGDRKSMANQMRMKSIANLASDNTGKKRRRGGDEDTFGADDADWGVYRAIATGEQSDDNDEELQSQLKQVEGQLLEHDPAFTEASTREAQTDWTQSLLHAFGRGVRPFDGESQRELHQVHLNVERIRIAEAVFQPAIAGLDQAGIVESAAGILAERLAGHPACPAVLRDIFLTGGHSLLPGFPGRLQAELTAVLPAGSPLHVRRAGDGLLDGWRGAAQWASTASAVSSMISRADWLEKGGDYIKEHELGNPLASGW